jgi:hypothetical protein
MVTEAVSNYICDNDFFKYYDNKGHTQVVVINRIEAKSYNASTIQLANNTAKYLNKNVFNITKITWKEYCDIIGFDYETGSKFIKN